MSPAEMAAEAALRESEQRFHTLADNIAQLAWMADNSGYIFWYNRRWFEYTGTTLEEMKGWGWRTVHHPDHRDRVVEKITRHFTTGEPWEDTFPLRGKDGEYRWFLSRAVPIRDENGQVVQWFGTNTDITELLQAQSQFQLVTDTLPQLVWASRPDGHVDYYNQRWYEYIGATFTESQGEGWSAFVHPEDQARTLAAWQGSMKSESVYEIEYRLRRHDGVYRWFIGRALPLRDASGRVIRWFGTCTDIDDQKRTEELLWQQQDEIAGLNVRLRRAMVETHHRVKNNLQMIAALIDMQRKDGVDALVPGSVLDRLTHNVTALGIIHDILTQEAKGDGEAQSLSARALLERLIHALQQTNASRRIVMNVEDIRLRGKRCTSLALAANEFIANALKHGKGDTTVTFRLDDGMAVLEVCDDGPGFPPDFDPVASANTGLELVESLIHFDLDGQTYYENRESGGARVRAVFPIASTGSSTEELPER